MPPLLSIEKNGRADRALLCTQQPLIKGEQRFVDLIDVIDLLFYKVLDDDIEFIAVGKGIPSFTQQVFYLIQI